MKETNRRPQTGGPSAVRMPRKRRTTLTLPAESLTEARRIATSRRVNLSTVVSEALTHGLREQARAQRADEILQNYRTAFSGFSDEEIALLNGVVLEPIEENGRS